MNLRPNLLPALGVFAAAARHKNFAHAAEELHLTASAVSHHVRRLEAALDVILFHRHARGVSLTGEGRQLADAATLAVADLQAVADSLGRSREGARLRISTLHSFSYGWLLPRLQRFLARHPGLRISIETDAALTRFEEGGADLAIRYGPGHWPGLNAHFLMDDELFAVASPTCPGVDAIETPAQIAGMVLLADNGFQGWRDWFRAAGLRGLRLPATHMLSDSSGVLRAAAAGIGAALARKRIVENHLVDRSLVRLPGPALTTRYSYYVVYPAHRAPAADAEAFIEWIEQEAQADASVVPQLAETARTGKRRQQRRNPS